MKNTFRLLITFILVLSLVLGATSCELLDELISEGDDQITSSTDGTVNDEINPEPEEPENKPENKPEYKPEDKLEDDSEDNIGDNTEDNMGDDTGDNTEKVPVINTDFEGGIIYLPNEPDPVITDPYLYVDKETFYANYTPAVSYRDAYYRSMHGLMSGSIGDQDQAPTVSDYQPVIDGMLVKNTAYLFSEDGNTYYVVDAYGNIVNKIYKGGAYVMLEEVAAYVFAFGTYPANHSSSKKTSPTSSPWGEFLRLNHSQFSGSTTKYPYEPELPNISGCGGDLTYFEMDVGTTGTDCDPSYDIVIYNDGTKITRGAARIVYTRQDLDRDGVIEVGEIYLFYTYNHYNDFQEYLGYEGGWGVMFGNVTGGGTLSSKYDYNPTPYVEVAYTSLVKADGTPAVEMVVVTIAWMPKREEI